MSRKNTACFITRKDALLYLCCFLQNLVENLGSWLLVVILLSLLPSHFQLNLYLKKPCQILKSGIVLSVHLCCSSAAGEADFPPGVETQGWFMLKRTSSCNTGHRRIIFLVLSAHQGCCCLLGLGPGVELHWLGVGFLWSLLMVLSYLQGLGHKRLDVSGINLNFLHSAEPQHRLRGWSLFRVLQCCLHCSWVQLGP